MPGRGLLIEQYSALRKRQSHLSVRRVFSFEIGQEAGICTRTVSFTGRDAANYTTILGNGLPAVAAQVEMNCPPPLKLWWAAFARRLAAGGGWIPWSDLHRRIAVYKTAPVAAEAQGLQNGALTWICTTSFRLRRAACRTNYTLRANWYPWPDLHRLGSA